MRHFLRKQARRFWGNNNNSTTTTTTTAVGRETWYGFTAPRTRSYHFSSPVSDPATLRLYRILLRQCQALQPAQLPPPKEEEGAVGASPQKNQQQQQQILLQPPLNPHLAGLSRVHLSSLPPNQPTAHHVLRLFGQWREQELSDRIMNPATNHHVEDDDDDDDEEEEAIAEEEDKLISWLTPIIAPGADPWMDTSTLWTTPETIRQAVRLAFRHNHAETTTTTADKDNKAADVSEYRTWAIRAYQYLVAQAEMQRLVRCREESGVRITTVARCVGRSASAQRMGGSHEPLSFKYRFVYRIRIENTHPDRVFQLLGRSWIIQERKNITSNGSDKKKSIVFGDEGSSSSIKVHAPQTGAVGKHPVLEPGQFFEYMSGCDLATPEGIMKGSFHFAWVSAGTPSASVGQAVQALDESHADRRFEVPVTPFPLQPDTLPVQFDP
eukprot:scaffold482_cov266-Amphora_coffeaeformis.AAC.16